MAEFVHSDPYTQAAILGEQSFELRGSGLAVPLFFKPDAAFIMRTVLGQEAEFTRQALIKTPGFEDVCEGAEPEGRFRIVFSDIQFALDALGSKLIQATHAPGMQKFYRRNPDYAIADERQPPYCTPPAVY
jgi:hypothetical protein